MVSVHILFFLQPQSTAIKNLLQSAKDFGLYL